MKSLVMIGWVYRNKDLSSRADGVSFHLNMEDAEAYAEEHWGKIENENNGRIPEDYAFPVMYEPRVVKAYGDLFERTVNTKNGLRMSQEELESLGEGL